MTRWHRTETINVKDKGRVRRIVFTRRKVRTARACSHCGGELVAGSLFWQRGHRVLHIECFEQMRRRAATVQASAANNGRRPVLDKYKMAAIVLELKAAKDQGRPFSSRTVARQLNVSDRTVRRFINNEYQISNIE